MTSFVGCIIKIKSLYRICVFCGFQTLWAGFLGGKEYAMIVCC